jgi:hypothetical protein
MSDNGRQYFIFIYIHYFRIFGSSRLTHGVKPTSSRKTVEKDLHSFVCTFGS